MTNAFLRTLPGLGGDAGPGVGDNSGMTPQRRAILPDRVGFAERDGVRLAYEVFGRGEPTVLLLPSWQIIGSQFWKLQVGFLSRHYRVVTYDGRGSGASGRPRGPAAYSNSECAADILAVLDATGTEAAVLVSLSCGAPWAVMVAADHPERVQGIVAISPSCGFEVADPGRDRHPWDVRVDGQEGWATYNKFYWLDGDFDSFRRFFFGRMCSTPHSSKQYEDFLTWSAATDPAVLVDATAGRLGLDGALCPPLEQFCRRVRCPVVTVHGSDDRIRPLAIATRLAELTGGSLILAEGADHALPAREPVMINRLIREVVDAVHPTVRHETWVRAAQRRRRVLFLSSPIGLGDAQRDVAIAAELRREHPDIEITWLAEHPVTAVLENHGERIHPASGALATESAHIESEGGEHDLNAFAAIRRMDEIMVNNFMVFSELVQSEHFDLVVGDEAWDVDHFLHENPELKRFPFAWMTDFVGWLPMPDADDRERRLTADLNAEMLEHRARFGAVRDRSIFVGSPDDVVSDPFGPGLPAIRSWVESNYDFAGYVTGFDPAELPDPAEVRSRWGCGPDERLCIVTVGGSGVGQHLLRRVLDAVPAVRRRVPDLRFLVVAGPRIDPASLPQRAGARVTGFVPDLYRDLAACDMAVVQGGLTTCMELTASRKPFVYVPLGHHFEQNIHVRHRLDRYRAGRCLPYQQAADPDLLADALIAAQSVAPAYRPVETDGARRAAALLADLL